MKGCSWKSCSFGSNTIFWNNFLTYHWLILPYCFHQKILKEKTAIFKNAPSLVRVVFFTQGTRALRIMLTCFPSCDIMNYFYIQWACFHNLCMNRASLDREWLDRVSWTRTTPWWFLYFWHCPVNTWNQLDVDKKFIWGLRRKMLKWMACMHLTYLLYHIKSVSLHSQWTQKKLADFKPCFFAVIQINWRK